MFVSSVIGTAVEWYDFLIYATATALVFNKLFFPSSDPALSDETPVFREIEAKNEVARLPLVEVLTLHRRAFFTAVGLKLSEISYAQIGGVFAIAYVTGKLAMPRSVILNAIFVSSVVALVAIPLFGWLSDTPFTGVRTS